MLNAVAKHLLALSALAAPVAWAATPEAEPNNTCAAAQDLAVAGEVTLAGSIAREDVDFFSFAATPGSLWQVDMRGAPSGAGTLGNMLLGRFDDSCMQAVYGDNSENGRESRLVFQAPASGVVRIAAAGNPDYSFSGTNTDTGTYSLRIGAPTVPVIAFSGRLTDAVTGAPLTRDNFAVVNLMSCPSLDYEICTSYMAQGIPDADGRYAIAQAIPPGVYQIRVLADNHASINFPPFNLTGFEGASTRDYALQPLPVVISDVTPCQTMQSGASCVYSYRVTNSTDAVLEASLWSQVDHGPSGTPVFRTIYSMGKAGRAPMAVTLAPRESREVVQSIPLRGLPSGSPGSLVVYASARGNQTDTIGYVYGFNFTVTARDTAVSSVRSGPLAPPRQTKALLADAANAGPDRIGGVALDPLTQQPITDGSVSVQLQVCQDASYDLCLFTAGLFEVDANGRFAASTRGLAPGRYQLWAFRQDGSTYGLNYSRAFDYDGGTKRINITAAQAPLKYGTVGACAGADALSVGSPCIATYELTNTTAEPLTLNLWAVISVYESGSVQGYSQFDMGVDGSPRKSSLTIAPGATVSVSHNLPLAQQLPSGTSASAEFFASIAGRPTMTLGNTSGFFVSIVP